MSLVSIIIPVRGEQYQVTPGVSVLQRTVEDIFEKAIGEIEVIVVFDGPPYQDLPDYPNLIIIRNAQWAGTKVCLNQAVELASGYYIMKVDAHCMFAEGFDIVLQNPMEDNWVVMPRFYTLDVERWMWQDEKYYDYFMLPWPFTHPRGVLFKAGTHWNDRRDERVHLLVDENLRNHGSCFFMARNYFITCLGGLDANNGAGSWNGEDIEITMKTWLGSWNGKIMVNKNTWFAHMHRGGQRPREFGFSHHEAYESARWSARYWMSNSWEQRTHDFEWLIEKFWPLPGWPDDWRTKITEWKESLG